MKVSRDFWRSEFECDCGCGFAAVDVELLTEAQRLRTHFGAPVRITSGCRCPQHNSIIGGAGGSWHTKAMAIDFIVQGVSLNAVHAYLLSLYPDKYGIALYSRWIHWDVRPTKARWGRLPR
jgi:uncharacterized protein YcbK (DUF882 family)